LFHFRPHHRIRLANDFKRIYAARLTARDDLLLVYAAGNGLEHPRLGLSVSRKVGGAVVRNRWKRLLREAFRLEQRSLPAGVDLVTIPLGREKPELELLRRSLVDVARRAARKLEKKKAQP
jgi:ribonuclease P protein component